MRIAKGHPIANWLRCDRDTYSRSLDRVLIERDKALESDPTHSGLPEGAIDWFWKEQLPSLVQKPNYRHQVEQHRENLELALLAIKSDINRATVGLIEEKLSTEAELARISAVLGDE